VADALNVSRILTADRGDARRRLDLVLCRHLSNIHVATRTQVQRWIEDGRVTVNGACVRRTAFRPVVGDVLTIAFPPDIGRPRPLLAENVLLHILYEDDHLIAIDKPVGMVAHPTYRHAEGTLMNALAGYAREWPAGDRPSLVNRIDKLTSGIVLVAKRAAMHAALQRTMSSNESEKTYLAVTYGRMDVDRGRIDLPLTHDATDRRRMAVSRTAEGAPSVTLFERLDRVAAPRVGLSLVQCRLLSGRTHQIRVHLAARGWPIVGDSVYGGHDWSRIDDMELRARLKAFDRQALHATRIALTHPVTGRQLVIEAPLPLDLQELLTASDLRVHPAQAVRTIVTSKRGRRGYGRTPGAPVFQVNDSRSGRYGSKEQLPDASLTCLCLRRQDELRGFQHEPAAVELRLAPDIAGRGILVEFDRHRGTQRQANGPATILEMKNRFHRCESPHFP